MKIEAGRYAAAGDPLETMRPGYAVVAMQQKQKRQTVAVKDSYLGEAQRSVVIEHAPRASAIGHAVELSAPAGGVIPARVPEAQASLDHDLSGVAAAWVGSGAPWNGWMPHPDFVAAREFTHGSATHDEMWEKISTPGWLTLRGQLDLWRMLVPATQPLSLLPWTPEPETVTLTFFSDARLEVTAAGGEVVRHRENKTTLTFTGARENVWPEFTLKLATPARRLEVGFTTTRDSITRPLASRRFLVPFARPAPPDDLTRGIPEITGGDWSAGHALFLGKAACATCHLIRGEGVNVGPDLSNLIHSDFASLLKNIVEPSASINPDAVGYTVVLRDASVIIGTRQRETADELDIAQPGGAVAKLKKADIIKTEPMTVSLMPAGLDKILSKDELRDLMTFLLKASPN